MSPPLARHPERFHEERSDIAKDLADLAHRICHVIGRHQESLSTSATFAAAASSPTDQTVNGRRIVVQKRRPFAVFVGEGPVKTR